MRCICACLSVVMAGTGTPLRLRSGDPVVPAIHVLLMLWGRKSVGYPRTQTSLRSLRKLDCAAGMTELDVTTQSEML